MLIPLYLTDRCYLPFIWMAKQEISKIENACCLQSYPNFILLTLFTNISLNSFLNKFICGKGTDVYPLATVTNQENLLASKHCKALCI